MASNTQPREQMDQAKEKGREKAEQTKQGAQQAAQNIGGQTKDAFKDFAGDDNPVQGFVGIWEKVPTNAYFLSAAGSILISALLMFSGKQRAALFVGQWPPTIIALALMNKLLRPSREVA